MQEIAGVLGVEHILEGSVRKAGSALRITAQLIRAADDRHLWSETFNRELKDIFEIQEEIATTVASELKITLGVETSLDRLGGTDNVDAYGFYLLAQGQMKEGPCDTNKLALESTEAALALDPDFALAWALQASILGPYMQCVPTDLVPSQQDKALEAAQRAIELEPGLVTGYYALCSTKLSMGEFTEAEYAYRKATELASESPLGSETALVPVHYCAVGNLEKAGKIIERIRRNDPLNRVISNMYIAMLGSLGDLQQAEAEYERGRALFGDQSWMGTLNIGLLRLSAGVDVPLFDSILDSDPIWGIVKANLDSPEVMLEELHRFYNDMDTPVIGELTNISLWAAHFGDPEFALDAIEKVAGVDATYVHFVWYPPFHEARRLPRFKEFVRAIGLVDYWNEFGWPDFCRPLEGGDFECD